MAFLSIDDPDFWGRGLAPQEAVVNEGGHEGFATSCFMLGKSGSNPPFVASLRMDPGFVLSRHAHDCYRMEIIVKGSLSVGDRILNVGSVMITEPGVLYGPHIAGPEGCTSFEICSDFEGAHRMMLEAPSGELVTYDVTTPEGAKAVVENTKKQQESVRRKLQ
jgi:hypothetical protein